MFYLKTILVCIVLVFSLIYFSTYDDPALYDPELKKKLEVNRKVSKSQMDKVSISLRLCTVCVQNCLLKFQ